MSTGQTSSSFVRQLGVGGDRGVDLDVDEDLVQRLGHQAAAPSFSLTASGISSIRSTTRMPAASRRAIFSVAVSSLPSTIVPGVAEAHPLHLLVVHELAGHEGDDRQPQSFSFTHSESWASMRPPGSV